MDTSTTDDAIAALRKRPRMFLKRDSIRDLDIFLTGYCFGLDAAHPQGFPHGGDLRAFRRWVANRLGEPEHEELDTMLLAESSNDEQRAFQLFFALWDEFASTSKQE